MNNRLANNEIRELSICTDCYMFQHFGDDSLTGYVTPDMERDIKQGRDKLGDVIIGDRHNDDCEYECDWQCDCFDPHFSWSPCDMCDSQLGGNRHDVNIMQAPGVAATIPRT